MPNPNVTYLTIYMFVSCPTWEDAPGERNISWALYKNIQYIKNIKMKPNLFFKTWGYKCTFLLLAFQEYPEVIQVSGYDDSEKKFAWAVPDGFPKRLKYEFLTADDMAEAYICQYVY